MRTSLLRLGGQQLNPYSASRRGNKLTTGLTGLPVHPNPLPALLETYKATLLSLSSQIPQGVVYRQSAEAITQHRLQVVQKHAGADANQGGENAIQAIEKELNLGIIEEIVKMAEDEQSLVTKMAQWKPWEDLKTKPEPGQWEYFKIPASTSLPATD